MIQPNRRTRPNIQTLEADFVANGFSPLLFKLADDPNIVIAKMDATANDVPSPYEVSG